MAAQSKEFKLGDVVKCNSEHPQIAADKKDCGWSDAYHSFLKGTESTVIYAGDNVYDLKVGDTPHFCTVSCGTMLELLSVGVRLEGVVHNVEIKATLDPEHTGGSVNYYKVHVASPTTLPEAYDAEANDIIESLGLTFAEGNLFKAIWRMAADRNGKKKKGNNSVYDAEKLVFFAERVLVQEKAKNESK